MIFNCNDTRMILIFVNSIFNRVMRNNCSIKEFMFCIYRYRHLFGTTFTKKSLKIVATSFSSLNSLPFSSVFHWLYFNVKEGFHRIPECFIFIYIIQVKVFAITPFLSELTQLLLAFLCLLYFSLVFDVLFSRIHFATWFLA